MRTVHCPLCGLRYAYASELDVHVREDHAPAAAPEGQEVIHIPRARAIRPRGRHAVGR